MLIFRISLSVPKAACMIIISVCCSACKSTPAPGTAASSEASQSETTTANPNSLIADISGDYTQHLLFKGDDIQVGFIGTSKKGESHFNIGALKQTDDQNIQINSGISNPFVFVPNVEQDAGGGTVQVNRGETETKYSDATYRLYFDPKATPHSNGHITLSKIEKLQSKNAQLVRYHLTGQFQFDAATAPDQPSAACTHEVIMYVASHGVERTPMYRADLCGAKKLRFMEAST